MIDACAMQHTAVSAHCRARCIGFMRQRIAGAVEHFLDVRNKSDQQIAELIRRLEIDIVIDLNGFTSDARYNVLARRVAPLQVNYLGYNVTVFETSGGLHAHIAFIGTAELAERLKASKKFGAIIDAV
jgi:predicted O-linked N-acetylglucosamine transferase (SPINDLY family)